LKIPWYACTRRRKQSCKWNLYYSSNLNCEKHYSLQHDKKVQQQHFDNWRETEVKDRKAFCCVVVFFISNNLL